MNYCPYMGAPWGHLRSLDVRQNYLLWLKIQLGCWNAKTKGKRERMPKTIGELLGTTWCRLNNCALRDINPVCYRHRLPAISGSLFKVLVAGLSDVLSGIWPASSWHGRRDNDDDDVLLRTLKIVSWLCQNHKSMAIVERVAGEQGCWWANSSSWCYRFGPALSFLDSCQSPGSVSFRQPIRGVIAARSPSLIPRFKYTRSEVPLPAEPPRSGRGCGCGASTRSQ